MEPILKNGTRILRPGEYDKLRAGIIRKESSQTATLDFLLLTGMRYVESIRFWQNEKRGGVSWFLPESLCIQLPKSAVLKSKRKQPERWIKLTREGLKAVEAFLMADKPPAPQNWRNNLIRWATKSGLNPVGLGVKTTRKTWESWLIVSYPGRYGEIASNQGHTIGVAFNNYVNTPFNAQERLEIKSRVAGLFGNET